MLWLVTILLLFFLLKQVVDGSLSWCPPKNFAIKRNGRNSSLAVMTEIHGTSYNKSFLQQHQKWYTSDLILSHFIYHHIGIMGFDVVYLQILYNNILHSRPPAISDIYNESSCVQQWFQLGRIVWEPVQVPGEGNVTSNPLMKHPDFHKAVRGFKVSYDKHKHLHDWILVLDTDELLMPVNWDGHDRTTDWCSNTDPSITEIVMQSILNIATTTNLQSFNYFNNPLPPQLSPSDACLYESSIDKQGKCDKIFYMCMPVLFWHVDRSSLRHPPSSNHPVLPTRHSRIYEKYISHEWNATETHPKDIQPQCWKSIHRTNGASEFRDEPYAVHEGTGMRIYAPRPYHNVVSLEIAHKRADYHHDFVLPMVSSRIVNLVESYIQCMES